MNADFLLTIFLRLTHLHLISIVFNVKGKRTAVILMLRW
jgi:hypothetical protein